MAITLDENQERLVATKRLSVNKRPKYYNAEQRKKVTISADFEAYLILQGRSRNKEALDWLNQAADLAVYDSDRDALLDQAILAEAVEAQVGKAELGPIMEQFNRFRERFLIQGFEGVAEAGQFFADVQRPMGEIIAISNRHQHRIVAAALLKDRLLKGGVTLEQQKQIQSWNEPLTAY